LEEKKIYDCDAEIFGLSPFGKKESSASKKFIFCSFVKKERQGSKERGLSNGNALAVLVSSMKEEKRPIPRRKRKKKRVSLTGRAGGSRI